ncbi:TAXI family TRAP transporter solute-binding subunit [Desulfococcus sp.]|uniref:TAXI family TRAP transporter solute-binding subunit n=1 Tax=Desulfococcus sp. TaxID=2025834 RepID=UPI0035947F77
MKTSVKAIVGTLFFLILAAGAAFAEDLGLITGGEKGTYYQFGLNLQELAKEKGINLSVYNSKGSIENIYAVFKRPRTQMGIVQSDVLAFVAKVRSNPVLARIAEKTKMVFPLYNEEVHLLGRQGIADFKDLAGKRVAVDREGSGTYLTANLLFEVSGVKPAEILTVGTDEALAQLKAGAVDAMFYVAGVPVKLFTEKVAAEDALALIPIRDKSIVEYYPEADIPANSYAWQPGAVPTVAVKAVLISYEFRGSNCDLVGRFAGILADNMDWLKANGHPKWKSVDLDYPLKGWEQYACVVKHIGKTTMTAPQEPSEPNPVLDAVKEMLKP